MGGGAAVVVLLEEEQHQELSAPHFSILKEELNSFQEENSERMKNLCPKSPIPGEVGENKRLFCSGDRFLFPPPLTFLSPRASAFTWLRFSSPILEVASKTSFAGVPQLLH